MIRITSLLTVCLVLCLSVVSHATIATGPILFGNSWGQEFKTDHKPNLVNLWTDNVFEKATGLPSGWTYWQSADGKWVQLYTTGNYGINELDYKQWWIDSKPTTLYLDWQECHYDWTTGTMVQSWSGGLKGYWSNATYGSAGGPNYCPGPVPEPGSILLLASGFFGIGLIGWFRKRKV